MAQRELVVDDRLLDSLRARPGQRRVGLVDGDRPARPVRRAGPALPARELALALRRLVASPCAPALAAAARKGRRDDQERDERRRRDPERDAVCPLAIPATAASTKQTRETDSISTRPP